MLLCNYADTQTVKTPSEVNDSVLKCVYIKNLLDWPNLDTLKGYF